MPPFCYFHLHHLISCCNTPPGFSPVWLTGSIISIVLVGTCQPLRRPESRKIFREGISFLFVISTSPIFYGTYWNDKEEGYSYVFLHTFHQDYIRKTIYVRLSIWQCLTNRILCFTAVVWGRQLVGISKLISNTQTHSVKYTSCYTSYWHCVLV